jgi:hypothetical protein
MLATSKKTEEVPFSPMGFQSAAKAGDAIGTKQDEITDATLIAGRRRAGRPV